MMKYFALLLAFYCNSALAGVTLPILIGHECKYKKVNAVTTDTDGGITVPDGETYAVYSFQASGSDPSGYVSLMFDRNGPNEKIMASTKGDINIQFDTSQSAFQVTGTASGEKIQIILTNDGATQTPTIGGCVGVIKI